MHRQTVILITSPAPECWGNFKKLCEAKGWVYQSLFNKGLVPKIDKPVKIEKYVIHRVLFQ